MLLESRIRRCSKGGGQQLVDNVELTNPDHARRTVTGDESSGRERSVVILHQSGPANQSVSSHQGVKILHESTPSALQSVERWRAFEAANYSGSMTKTILHCVYKSLLGATLYAHPS